MFLVCLLCIVELSKVPSPSILFCRGGGLVLGIEPRASQMNPWLFNICFYDLEVWVREKAVLTLIQEAVLLFFPLPKSRALKPRILC